MPSFAKPRGGSARQVAEGVLVLAIAGAILGVFLARPQQPAEPAINSSRPVSAGPTGPSSSASPSSTPDPTPDGSVVSETATPTISTPTATRTPPTIGSGEWRMMATSPIRAGGDATAAWTGTEFIIWGTDGLLDGAAYDPATDTWRPLPDGPRGPAEYMAAVWTGEVVVSWHGGPPAAPGRSDGGIYNPATDSWSPISPGPLHSDYGQGVAWTGSELLVLSPDMRAAAYDPTTDDWRDLPSPPLPPGAVEADWTGSEWLVLGFGTDPDAAAEVAAFDPESGTWSRLATSPMTEQNLGRDGIWTGQNWLWLAPYESFAYDPVADQWRAVDTSGCLISTDSAIWTGSEVLTRNRAFDPTTGTCFDIPPAPQSVLVSGDPGMAWTGMELLVWGGSSGSGDPTTTDGAAFSPAD